MTRDKISETGEVRQDTLYKRHVTRDRRVRHDRRPETGGLRQVI